MTDAKLNYVGPAPKALSYDKPAPVWWRRLPLGFLVIVVVPTLIAALYYFVIASPRYVSEARFVVRQPSQAQPSSLGVALQGVGISPGQTDAFAVHEYINSRDGLNELTARYDLATMLKAAGADPLSRYPRFWEGGTEEDLFKAFQRFVTVGYDSTTGISTLRVEAFRPQDAKAVSEALLMGGESLVNRLNTRAATDAVSEAEISREQARSRLSSAQQQLTAFRNREQFIDPARTATEASQLIGGLLETVANLRAERAQIASQAAQSPQLPIIDSRIAAFERQVEAERAKVAGNADSLAPKIGTYEDLSLAREFADRELAQATTALLTAEQEARRQRLYLDRIVNPSLPDKATEPRRMFAVITVLLSTLLVYGVGWLIWAGVREHRQA